MDNCFSLFLNVMKTANNETVFMRGSSQNATITLKIVLMHLTALQLRPHNNPINSCTTKVPQVV